MDPRVGPREDDRFARFWALALVVVVAAVEWMGFAAPSGAWWGVDAYGFLPGAAIAAATALLLVAVLPLLHPSWDVARFLKGARTRSEAGGARSTRWPEPGSIGALLPLALAMLGGLVFWSFRTAHVFLGDGIVLA